ncbi:diguanylate cyclase [Actinoplanes sp. NPDC023936]|uniref:diguanylate cyclase domain-containing protein n=1 Tax=Actinoplanes sp. NPDC023936 TaxID=3154910 RepID=UPI0033C9A1DF
MHTWTNRVPPSRASYRALGLLYAVTTAALLAVDAGGGDEEWIAETARFGFGVFGMLAALRAARLPDLPARLRRAWTAVAGCFGVLVLSVPVLCVLNLSGLNPGDAKTADDVIHVIFVVALLIALQLFPLAKMRPRDRAKNVLDAMTVLVGGSLVLWYTAVDPMIHSGHDFTDGFVSAVLYPIGDLALLFTVARALLRGADDSARRPLQLLTAGTLVLFAGDAVNGYLNAHGITVSASWQFYWWITSDALLAAAAVEQSRPARRAGFTHRPGFRIGRCLPYLAVMVAPGLMLYSAIAERHFSPWGGLAIGGAALSALVLSRQTLVQRESDELALIDGLTGLANRSRFRETSHRGLHRDARAGLHSAVLVIDMNSFKEINDTFGHQAGDAVLVELADVLRRCVPSPGLPARLGGDEFAVTLSGLASPRQAYETAGRIAAALGPVAVDGRLITLAASIGVAVSAPGELHHDELVHRADLAMYKAKALGPETRWAVWQESLEAAAGKPEVAA